MYEIFEKLCQSMEVTPYKVCKDTGLTTSTISNWKAGRYIPKQDKLKKIADYFDVSVDYLMTGKDEPGESERDFFSEEIRAIARDAQKLSPDKKKLLAQLIKSMSNDADEELKK